MKVFQTIHKYEPYISVFEKKYDIKNQDLSFSEIRDLLIKDGYASTYILKPALEKGNGQVFFTIWDYERLQFKWAEEQNLKTKNLEEIKLAQLESFKPDVFYNHSPRYDNNFVNRLNGFNQMKKVCWDGIITEYPWMHELYDARVTLFEPYVKYWNSKGLVASLLTPAYVPSWKSHVSNDRDIDVLFYGQISSKFFSGRNQIIAKLLKWQTDKDFNVKVHLQDINKKHPLINIKGFRRLTSWINKTPKVIRKYALGPIYGQDLYDTIGNSKIVINAFTNYNGLFKDNMRTYEAIGMGALLIGEDGIYPDFIDPREDILTYRGAEELITKIEDVLANTDKYIEMSERSREKLMLKCSKEKQWDQFLSIVERI